MIDDPRVAAAALDGLRDGGLVVSGDAVLFANRAAHRLTGRAALGLVVVDLDHFKPVNDEHGHPLGDRVLAEAGRRIAAEARAIDSVGCIGGEEFAWLVPDAAPDETLSAAERLRGDARPPVRKRARAHPVDRICDLAAGATPSC